MVRALLEAVTLTEYADKLCGTYRWVLFIVYLIDYDREIEASDFS